MSKKIVKPPQKAFILGAGFGTRLRPYTNDKPKPMVEVAGRSLIRRALDKLLAAGVVDVTVNTHYLGDVMAAHLRDYERDMKDAQKNFQIHIAHEDPILDTGGGVRARLGHFGDDPFYVIAGDSLWEDSPMGNALHRLSSLWHDEKMDIITLMQPLKHMSLTGGAGDYKLLPEQKALRMLQKDGTHMWTNIRLNHPRIYREYKIEPFSFLPILDQAQAQGRLCALEHDGEWHHISTPADLETVDRYYKEQGR